MRAISRSDTGQAGAVLSLLVAFVATAVVAGILGAGLMMPVVGASGSLARSSVDFFDELPEDFATPPLSQQSRILYANGSPMATFYSENRVLVPLSKVAPAMRNATVAIEDSRFYEHNGIDPRGISRALVNNYIAGRDAQGASTLTQQWIKNVLLDQARTNEDEDAVQALLTEDKGRKIREWKLALAAEKKYDKDEILGNYLNIAAFGDGQYGVQTASQHWFGKSASDLALGDAAMLAGMIQSPSRYDPVDDPENARQRRDVVLKRMLDLKMISKAEHDEAAAVPLQDQLDVQPSRNGCEQAQSAAYFCDYVVKVLLADEAFGRNAAARERLLYSGGLTITTTLDRERQKAGSRAVRARLPIDGNQDAAAALSSVEPGTGRIVAMAQNRVYDPGAQADVGGTAINYNVDEAYGGLSGFQVGSNYKPFTLATWLMNGKSLSDRISASRSTYRLSSDFTASCSNIAGAAWTPRNSDGNASGTISVEEATYNSVNTAYVHMATQLDLCQIRDTAEKLGVHRADGGELFVGPSSVLGVNEIAPLTMASAYAAFAASGRFCNPVAITSVTDRDGKKLGVPEADCRQAIDADVANAVTYALEKTLQIGTADDQGIDRPAAGKTATTNNSTETWFTGYTPALSTSVWVGTPNSDTESLGDLQLAGFEERSSIYGSTIAAPTWHDYMVDALEGVRAEAFPEPSQRTVSGPLVTVPATRGASVASAEQALEGQGLRAVVGGRVESSRAAGSVAGTDPGAGARVRRGSTVQILISSGPPPPPPPAPEPSATPKPSPTPSASPKPSPKPSASQKPSPKPSASQKP